MCDGLILLIIEFKEFSYSLSCSVSFPLQKFKEGKALVRYHSVTTERREIWPKADSETYMGYDPWGERGPHAQFSRRKPSYLEKQSRTRLHKA